MVYQNCKEQGITRGLPRVLFFLYPFSFFLILVSCVSVPSVPTPEKFYSGRSGFALMAEGAEIYITAQVEATRPILDSLKLGGMSGAELKQFLDMSDVLTAAIFPTTGGRRFYAAASGKFPNVAGGLFFSTSKDWEKKLSASGISYWYSQHSQLSVSLDAKTAYLSNGDPFVPPPGAAVPEALPALQRRAVLSGWMNNPAPSISRFVASLGVPIEIPAENLIFAVYPADTPGKDKKPGEEMYSAALRFETGNPSLASGLVRIVTLAKVALALADFKGKENLKVLAEAFFSQNPRAEGSGLIITIGAINGKDLALLFNALSLY